jgi:hypothetical protein
VAKAVGERKRGRRPKWPFIPKWKTEDFDKFWIRRYRTFLKKQTRSKQFVASTNTDAPAPQPSDFVKWFISEES